MHGQFPMLPHGRAGHETGGDDVATRKSDTLCLSSPLCLGGKATGPRSSSASGGSLGADSVLDQ